MTALAEESLAVGIGSSATPSVGVVIATRDRPELLRRAIDAILAQEYGGTLSVTVVFDQCDPDPTIEAMGWPDRPVRATSNDRTPGLAGARNTGILATDTTLIAFCDDDDAWLPGKLAAQVRLLESRPDAIMCSCGIVVEYGDVQTPRVLPRSTVTFHDLLRRRVIEVHPSTFLIRRAAVIGPVGSVGLVSEEIPGAYGEDYEWLLRVAKQAPIVSVGQPLVTVHWHVKSYFTGRWETIAAALSWLLDRYPEFGEVPAGRARIEGQIAFAWASAGSKANAFRWISRCLRGSWREPRAYLAAGVASRLVKPDRVLSMLQRSGKSI
jgi:glycosyltransferase involved in cell wall biosynthesis